MADQRARRFKAWVDTRWSHGKSRDSYAYDIGASRLKGVSRVYQASSRPCVPCDEGPV